ncbi:hypothetical protein MTO96_050558 [Rhipicephalus appendiculatus]
MRDDYWYNIVADFVVSKQTNINFYNTVLSVERVCSSEEIDEYFELIFTIAPTYCNSRVKYDTTACKPVTTEVLAKGIGIFSWRSPYQTRTNSTTVLTSAHIGKSTKLLKNTFLVAF